MGKLSASAVSMFRACPYSFYYKYIEKYKLLEQTENENLSLGLAFHHILENDNTIQKDFSDIDEKTFLSIRASAEYIYNNYLLESVENKTLCDLFTNNRDIVKEFKIDQSDFIGYIDLVIPTPNGDILIDYKYVSSFDYADSYKISDQSKIYPALYTKQTGRPVVKMIYLCVAKPTIRLKKTETKEQYLNRVKEWYLEGNKVKEVLLCGDDLKELRDEFDIDLSIIQQLIENEMYYKNPSNCNKYGKKCDYYPLCYQEPDYECLYKKS